LMARDFACLASCSALAALTLASLASRSAFTTA